MHKMKCMKSLPIFVCKIQENTKKKRHKLSHTIKKYVLIQMKRFLCEWKKKKLFRIDSFSFFEKWCWGGNR